VTSTVTAVIATHSKGNFGSLTPKLSLSYRTEPVNLISSAPINPSLVWGAEMAPTLFSSS